ncbi:MAG: hypothetical protein Q9212_002674 [Teloschistes hypoglaucus]
MSDPQLGELSLAKLLSSFRVSMHEDTFVFLTFPASGPEPPANLPQQMCFREKEGLTIITTVQSAQENELEYTFPSRMITCEVHSSLEAVGFMAALTRKLTECGIGANPVSGFYHDHLFVPAASAEHAMRMLMELAHEAAVAPSLNQPA